MGESEIVLMLFFFTICETEINVKESTAILTTYEHDAPYDPVVAEMFSTITVVLVFLDDRALYSWMKVKHPCELQAVFVFTWKPSVW